MEMLKHRHDLLYPADFTDDYVALVRKFMDSGDLSKWYDTFEQAETALSVFKSVSEIVGPSIGEALQRWI